MDSYNINLLKQIRSHQECALVSELYHHIGNFNDDFVGKIKHTLVLSPVASGCVGFDIFGDVAVIGVPQDLFDIFLNIRWYGINIIKDHPAMFWLADFGTSPKNHPVALRFSMRTTRSNSLAEFKQAIIVKLNKDGYFEPPNPLNSFPLSINIKKNLDWEKV
ncbi:hypothetical protein ACI2KR_07260 [Pseudomonas luteola]